MEAGLLRDAINQGVDIGGGTDETSALYETFFSTLLIK